MLMGHYLRLFSALFPGRCLPALFLLLPALFFPFQVQAGESGRLFVYPEPEAVRITVLETEKEYAPGLALSPGDYRIRITKFGYRDYQKAIFIEPGQNLDLFVELEKKNEWTEPETGLEFVRIPSGCFQMGCGEWAAGCDADESPVHRVCVREFWMSRHEVTQGVWLRLMGQNPSRFQKGERYPVEQVSWDMAQDFIQAFSIAETAVRPRLPTEAEWEFAARGGGKEAIYAGGRDISALGWYTGNSRGSTHPVGKKQANPLGLYDMSGNVWEWCLDAYQPNEYKKGEPDNPVSADKPLFRVRRGGDWTSEKHKLRTLYRGRYPPDLQFESNGLRVVLEVDQDKESNTK
ncbi:MAG: SUMF1/EgtB/PvdO family nonheme iron enzyme [Desulfohalobiaceae bacterium]|nr:SUMF1/EgtB/PvdO family nonheme iron enzyme [Desulfohalobiaceae bacterium]